MPVRSAKSHRRSRRSASAPRDQGHSDPASGNDAAEETTDAPRDQARAAPAEDSVDARLTQLKDAFGKLRAAVHDVRSAAVALARGEVQAFARRGRRLRART